jgi:hypothetical protein
VFTVQHRPAKTKNCPKEASLQSLQKFLKRKISSFIAFVKAFVCLRSGRVQNTITALLVRLLMNRFFLVVFLWVASLSVQARNPPEEWKAYRIARVSADGKSSQERVQIWSNYLVKYPESPYRHRALEELQEASDGFWISSSTQTSKCLSDADLNRALGLAPEPVLPVLLPSERLTIPNVSTKRPIGAGLRSWGATYGGALLGMALVNSKLSDNNLGLSAGIALWGTAMVVGPSAGHLYAGDKVHAKKLIAARAVAAGAIILGGYQVSGGEANSVIDSYNSGITLLVVGLSTGTALVFYDLIDSFLVVQRKQGRPVKNRVTRSLGALYTPRF